VNESNQSTRSSLIFLYAVITRRCPAIIAFNYASPNSLFAIFLSFTKKLSRMAIAKTPLKKTPEKKEGLFKRSLNLTWEQFTSTTTIHGLKHVNDPRGNRFTKFFWISVPFFCFLCAIALMATFLMRYKSNPTRINVETFFGPISEIEFPSITFCNPNFITDSQVQGLIKSIEVYPEGENNRTNEELVKMVKYIAGFTNPISVFNDSELPYLQAMLQDNRFDVQLTMKKLMYPCTKLMFRCRWEGVIMDCKELFTVSETYQGYCCSFNILKPIGSSLAAKKPKIRKTQYFGPEMGLSVIMNPLIERNAMTSVNSEGMKILVNEPILYPSQRMLERMLPHQQESYVEIRPERTDCSKTVRSLSISDRGCVFSNEYQLK
jgi:acid-sensing ion channel, other